jgi:CDGSH-type Zn-finger protein
MGICKCGLSDQYPECDGTHVATKNDNLRAAIIKAFEDNKHLLENN